MIDAEHIKQRSGAIDDNQISALGKQLGVRQGNEFEDGYVEDDKNGSTRLGHGGDVRVGAGYRF